MMTGGAATEPARNPLNAFQRLMRDWNEIHPYNAVTIVKIAGAPDVARLRAAARRAHEALGIDGFPLPYEVRQSDEPSGCDLAALGRHATRELNRGFDDEATFPARLWMLPRAGYHYIGQTFQHSVGDAYFLNSVLCRVLAGYLDVDVPAALTVTDPDCPTIRRAFASSIGPHRWCTFGGRMIGELLRARRCHRPAYGDQSDLSARVRFPLLPDDLLERLRTAARGLGVTVNEIILAALAEAIALNTPERLTDLRRRELALMAIVDLRPLRPELLMDKMGLYLSYFTVFCTGDDAQFSNLLPEIHRQSANAKATRSHLKAAMELQLAVTLWPRIPREQRIGYFSRCRPIVAGLSNMRLRDDWLAGGLDRRLLGCWWAASPGPMAPLAVLVTTSNGRLTCSLSSRASGFRPDVVDAIETQFVSRLAGL